jgi:hypothetical protein
LHSHLFLFMMCFRSVSISDELDCPLHFSKSFSQFSILKMKLQSLISRIWSETYASLILIFDHLYFLSTMICTAIIDDFSFLLDSIILILNKYLLYSKWSLHLNCSCLLDQKLIQGLLILAHKVNHTNYPYFKDHINSKNN